MKPQDLQHHLEILFGKGSPGQAFDSLVAMRQDNVTLENIRLFLSDSVTQTEIALSTPVGQLDEFTENTPMPFGKHKGVLMHKLPSEYLAWLFRQGDELSHKPMAKFLKTYKRAIACSIANPVRSNRSMGAYVEDEGHWDQLD